MIDLFKEEVNVGDKVKLILTTGKEPIGVVLEIGKNHILLENEDGNSIRIFEVLLGGWELNTNLNETNKSNEDKEESVNELEEKENEDKSDKLIENKNLDLVTDNEEKDDISETHSIITSNDESSINIKILGKIELDESEKIKNRFPVGQTYRLRQVSREFDLPISKIVSELKTKGHKIDNNPNFKIDQVCYDVVKELSINSKKQSKSDEKPVVEEIEQPIGLMFKSFAELNQLREKIDINVENQLLPGNAKIKRYGARHQYGFLSDNDGLDYHFKYSDIEDEKLLEKLQNFGAEGIQVICQLNNYNGKLIAKKIFLPQSVGFFQLKAETYFSEFKYNETEDIINLILTYFPDYNPAIELKNKIRYKRKRNSKIQEISYYQLAKRETKKGNQELAKEYYKKAIENDNSKTEPSIKELAYLLSGQGLYDDAIELVKNNSHKIEYSNPDSFIAYFYEAKKDYSKALEYLVKIKTKSPHENLKLSKRMAICYFGVGNYQETDKLINEIYKVQPKDNVVTKLRRALEIAQIEGSDEEVESLFKEVEMSALTGGFSNFMYFTLENCEFAGVPASEVSKGIFNEKTLLNLKKYIETIKDGRPRERAEAYLSQAKIEQIIDSENTKAINSSLARYCTSIAVSWAKDGRHVETLRYFLLEAATLEPIYDILKRYLPMYLQSFFKSITELRSNVKPNWNNILDEFKDCNSSNNFWFGILDLLIVNSKFSAEFLSVVFKHIYHKPISVEFISNYLGSTFKQDLDKDAYFELWKRAREKFKREKDSYNAKLLSLKQSKTSEGVIESFKTIKSEIPVWIYNLDRQRIATLDDVLETIIEFNKQESFEDKERYYNIVFSQINQLKDDILDSPTELSFNVLLSILDFIYGLIEYEFKNVIDTSKPVIQIQIYGEGSINKQSGLVNVQFSISNKKGSAPISFFELNIMDEPGIEFIKENNTIQQSLRGGDEKVLKICLKVKQEIINEGATNIKIDYCYKIRGSEELINRNEDLTLRFYSVSDFEKIDNPFAATADSGPVEDVSMFYGRDEFISNIQDSVLNSKSKCVIIYGQKRSGKSSVLHHLREQLNQNKQSFCISFSLGEIIEDLSPKTFYYTILTEIEDSLSIISQKSPNIPKYIAPDYASLNEAPAIMFNDQIKNLKREFSKYPEWSSKKIVLLIDEFTYIYTAIQKEYLSEQFMKTWKSFLEKGFFTSVLIGQDIMPKFKSAYPNEFGVTEDKRLSYLKKSDAIKLIEEPIWDKSKNRSRFLGKATELILDYTSSNPYYVQIFCARLVEYMNDNKAISVTEADVQDVAESFIKGEQALTADKFDNLLTAGDADLEAFNANDVLSALKAIAIASKNLDSCPREAINLGELDYEENLLQDLKDREVLSSPQPGYFKINVRLFKEWLLIN
jgi:lipopolysaccharide biosynthesis regulator YciM